MLLLTLLVLLGTAQDRAQSLPIEDSFIVLMQQCSGGDPTPIVCRTQIAIGCDWNSREFLLSKIEVTERNRTLARRYYWCTISKEEFTDLCDTLERTLRPHHAEDDANDTSTTAMLRFFHRSEQWSGPFGPRSAPPGVESLVSAFLASHSLNQGTLLDYHRVCRPAGDNNAAISTARLDVGSHPRSSEIDLRTVATASRGQVTTVFFGWRGMGPVESNPMQWPGYVAIQLSPARKVIGRTDRYPPGLDADIARRRRFLDDNDSLPDSLRDIIQAGYLENGMTKAMVQAVKGEPSNDPGQSIWILERWGKLERVEFDPTGLLINGCSQ